ncbi:ETS-domain lacking [Leptinotarsa decemlineata]|uniref:ETS-domain lacking n=1 Tax=Leptinotarsa decemlineata TaxID=7539 RepID=UPI000C2520D1|nr:transcription factor ETV6 [Leptinotarsa decemlineata]XP_023019663.1 transcription factor ETV6 [Leptinotarsa decemlineata]
MALEASASPIRFALSPEWGILPVMRDLQDEEDILPKDPRQWTRDDVGEWVRYVTSLHNIPEVPSSRFQMNGKALCLMSPSMFLARVPLGGKLLYKDFQLRLSSALYAESSRR